MSGYEDTEGCDVEGIKEPESDLYEFLYKGSPNS
jgi:hypothetical protein